METVVVPRLTPGALCDEMTAVTSVPVVPDDHES
jgi:hypothetical protein